MVLIVMAFAIACDTEDPTPGSENPAGSKVAVSFNEDEIDLQESESIEVIVQLNHGATKSGTISVAVESEFSTSFLCIPEVKEGVMELQIAEGAENIKFEITPFDNDQPDGDKSVTFTLQNASEGFVPGTNKSLTVTINDDEIPSEPQMVTANFSTASGDLTENVAEGIEVKIALSSPVESGSKLVIHQTGALNGLYYYTIPALDASGNLTLDAEPGIAEIKFKVIPINDGMLKDHQLIFFEITDSEGSISKGNQLTYSLKLLDKELVGKPKSYDTYGGGWRAKQTYHYNGLGQVSLVEWENYTPNKRSGSYTYYYADNGLVERVNHTSSRDEYFYQENGRIVKSEVVAYGEVASYSLYDYDAAGNIGARLNYEKNPQGEYVKSLLYIYLYYDNGNIYKQLTYIPGQEEGEEELISTRTFDTYYGDKTNHFPMFEVVPGIKAQPNLPAYHRIEENGVDLQYNLSYEFDELGNAISRTVTGSGTNEISYYDYY